MSLSQIVEPLAWHWGGCHLEVGLERPEVSLCPSWEPVAWPCRHLDIHTRRYNLLFFASGGGKFNYQGTKRWLEDSLDHTGRRGSVWEVPDHELVGGVCV